MIETLTSPRSSFQQVSPYALDDELDELPPIPDDESEVPGPNVARGATRRGLALLAGAGPHGADAASVGEKLAQDFAALAHDLPKPIKETRRVRWLHIPKCGSTFGGALYRYACGRDPDPNWTKDQYFQSGDPRPGAPCDRWHQYNKQSPLGSNKTEDDLSISTPFAMFRDPLKRQISAMKYANCSWSMCAPGFQVKFVLGLGWQSGRDVVWPDVQAATQKIRNDFAFVGLTDDWDVSMMLFHATYGTRLRADEMLNTRNTKYSQIAFNEMRAQLHEKHWTEKFDIPLIREVKQLMKERITERFSIACTKKPENSVCQRLKPWMLE